MMHLVLIRLTKAVISGCTALWQDACPVLSLRMQLTCKKVIWDELLILTSNHLRSDVWKNSVLASNFVKHNCLDWQVKKRRLWMNRIILRHYLQWGVGYVQIKLNKISTCLKWFKLNFFGGGGNDREFFTKKTQNFEWWFWTELNIVPYFITVYI